MTFPTVSYINYGPYTSYAPTYDSSFGNVSKEESDLIYSAFGDKSSVQGSDRYGLGGIPGRGQPQQGCVVYADLTGLCQCY